MDRGKRAGNKDGTTNHDASEREARHRDYKGHGSRERKASVSRLPRRRTNKDSEMASHN